MSGNVTTYALAEPALTVDTREDAAHGAPSAGFLDIVVGYDGSAPASRALDAAVRLLQGRIGCIDVVWVAHLSSTVRLSADAMVEMEAAFDELEPELRVQAAGQLRGRGADWEFERRQGLIAKELIAVAAGIRDARPGQGVVIVIGSSSHATHHMVGSVAVSLARHSPVPLVIVP
jgi:nucleotide-binding universal stress UspA family protein